MTVTLFLHVYQQLVSLQLNIKLMGRSVTIAEQQKNTFLFLFVHPGNMSMRWRGNTMRRMSMFPNANPDELAFTEDAIRNELENGKVCLTV